MSQCSYLNPYVDHFFDCLHRFYRHFGPFDLRLWRIAGSRSAVRIAPSARSGGSAPAIFIGRYLNRRLKGQAFYKYIYWGLMIIGGLLIGFTLKS